MSAGAGGAACWLLRSHCPPRRAPGALTSTLPRAVSVIVVPASFSRSPGRSSQGGGGGGLGVSATSRSGHRGAGGLRTRVSG